MWNKGKHVEQQNGIFEWNKKWNRCGKTKLVYISDFNFLNNLDLWKKMYAIARFGLK